MEHHQRVGARRCVLGVLVGERLAVGLVVEIDEAATVGADDEEVHAVLADGRRGERDPRDLGDLAVDVAVHQYHAAERDSHAQQDGESDAPEESVERGSQWRHGGAMVTRRRANFGARPGPVTTEGHGVFGAATMRSGRLR